jgi:hypothetical protein
MKNKILSITDKWGLSNYILKLLDRIIRDADLNDITFRVDLLNVQKKIEEILKKYEDRYKGKY